jgi:hypothetical protein
MPRVSGGRGGGDRACCARCDAGLNKGEPNIASAVVVERDEVAQAVGWPFWKTRDRLVQVETFEKPFSIHAFLAKVARTIVQAG